MIADALHVAWKDVSQHRAWIAAYLCVLALRALLTGSGVDPGADHQARLDWIRVTYQTLSAFHVALLVSLAVQLVHADRLVGTTAFWLTRPVGRGALLTAKLGLAVGLLVVVPVVVDALVILRYGLAPLDALGAVLEGVVLRTAVVLVVMALAAITRDLALFVVSAIAVLVASVAADAALPWRAGPPRVPNDFAESFGVVVVVIGFGALAAFAHQVFTRRTRLSVAILGASLVLALAAAHSVSRPLLASPTDLERGWIDVEKVSVILTATPPQQRRGAAGSERPWVVRAAYEISGSSPNAVLAPLEFRTTLRLANGTSESVDAVQQTGWEPWPGGPRFVRADQVERLLGGVRLVNARLLSNDQPPTPAIAALTPAEHEAFAARGGRFDVNVVLGALGYEVCRAVPLRPGARGRCGDREFVVLSAAFEDGACVVGLQDVAADFAIDLRRRSSISYLLVNRAQGKGVIADPAGDVTARPVFGRPMPGLLGEHLTATRRTLTFASPENLPGSVGPDWLKDGTIVPLRLRDIGRFSVKAMVKP